jgi:hypothetical protein
MIDGKKNLLPGTPQLSLSITVELLIAMRCRLSIEEYHVKSKNTVFWEVSYVIQLYLVFLCGEQQQSTTPN